MKLNNCSLGGDFYVSHHAKIYQFDRFSLEINFKRARSCWNSQSGFKLKNVLYHKRLKIHAK